MTKVGVGVDMKVGVGVGVGVNPDPVTTLHDSASLLSSCPVCSFSWANGTENTV